MKISTILTTLLVAAALPAGAVGFDTHAYGSALHGWRKDRTASYGINNQTYRTHWPTATATKDGGLYLSVRIEEAGRLAKSAGCFLELTFSASGQLVAGQIRATMGGKRLDTGVVTRPPDAAAPAVADGEVAEEGAAWESPTGVLVRELFTRFDTELGKLDAKDAAAPKRDLFGRLAGGINKSAEMPAAIRHNLNLILVNIR